MTKLSQCTLLLIMTICSFDIQAAKGKKNEPKRKRLSWIQHEWNGTNPRGAARAKRAKKLKHDRHRKTLDETLYEINSEGIKKHTGVEDFSDLQQALNNKAKKAGTKKPQFATSKRSALQILASMKSKKKKK